MTLASSCQHGHYEAGKLLVESGARLLIRDEEGNSPAEVAERWRERPRDLRFQTNPSIPIDMIASSRDLHISLDWRFLFSISFSVLWGHTLHLSSCFPLGLCELPVRSVESIRGHFAAIS
jgi:hypothetical protein